MEIFAHFFDKGFGSITKVETDVFLYYLIDKYQKNSNLNLSNFEWSSFLKISEKKIENFFAGKTARRWCHEIYIGEGRSIAEDKLKHAKWVNYKKDSLQIVKDMLTKAMPSFIQKTLFGI